MTYAESIKAGFRIVHRNWQLVLVQLGMVIISCIGFFVLVGIPLAVAFVMFGLDLTELTRLKDLLGAVRGPSEIISRYFGLLLVVVVSFITYLIAVTAFGLYVFGGSAGVIGRAVRDELLKFNMSTLFSEGRRLFFPLLGFTAIIGLIFIVVAFVVGIFGGCIAAIVSAAREHEATLALFLGIFFSLILLCIGLILIMGTLAFTVYGMASIVFKGIGPVKSIKETARYLYRRPAAFWLYCLLFMGYILASFLLILLGTPFTLIPIIGSILALPYQLFSYAVQSYLWLVIVGTTFIYYFSTEVKPYEPFEVKVATIVESSTQVLDTSEPQAPEQEAPPSEKEEKE